MQYIKTSEPRYSSFADHKLLAIVGLEQVAKIVGACNNLDLAQSDLCKIAINGFSHF